MKLSKHVVWMCGVLFVLSIFTAGAGLFWPESGAGFSFTTVRGEVVEMAGRGLYHFDPLFFAAAFKGTDAVTLFSAAPLLVWALVLYLRGSWRGMLLLLGALLYHLYYSASLAFGAAYNPMFLVYVAYFGLSLFTFVALFIAVDLGEFWRHIGERMPRRWIGGYLIGMGVVLFLIWMTDIVSPMVTGAVPVPLDSYTTVITYVLDLGLIVPALVVSGTLVLRERPLGYLLAAPLLALNSAIGVVVTAQTVAQRLAGVTLTLAQFLIFVASFVVVSLAGLWMWTRMMRNVSQTAIRQRAPL